MRLIRLILASWTMRAGIAVAEVALHMARRVDRGSLRFKAVYCLYSTTKVSEIIARWLAPESCRPVTPADRMERMGLLPRHKIGRR